MAKYKVKLDGFRFLKHVGPEGLALDADGKVVESSGPPQEFLAPVHKKEIQRRKAARVVNGQRVELDEEVEVSIFDTRPEHTDELVVEAIDADHAKVVFMKTLGIRNTTRDFRVTAASEAKPAAPSGSVVPAALAAADEDLDDDEDEAPLPEGAQLVDLDAGDELVTAGGDAPKGKGRRKRAEG